MREISRNEYIDILFGILEYVDELCKKNNINYSLIGGSLLGCVRHGDIIPWDDDIDIVLFHDDYKKLKKILQSDENSRYQFYDHEVDKSYFFPFGKVVDTKTVAIEGNLKKIDSYGVYIDVFEYNNAPNEQKEIIKFYNKITQAKKIFGIFADDDERFTNKSVIKKIRDTIIKLIGPSFFIKHYNKICRKYEKNNNCRNIITNWPIYGYKHEIVPKEFFDDYIYKKFRNINASIPKSYDEILKIYFGDYMKLPPEEQRVSKHNMKAYWR